eukprot:SAG31_NODE_1092_length_9957_cov_10.569284_6_plen_221_part_00
MLLDDGLSPGGIMFVPAGAMQVPKSAILHHTVACSKTTLNSVQRVATHQKNARKSSHGAKVQGEARYQEAPSKPMAELDAVEDSAGAVAAVAEVLVLVVAATAAAAAAAAVAASVQINAGPENVTDGVVFDAVGRYESAVAAGVGCAAAACAPDIVYTRAAVSALGASAAVAATPAAGAVCLCHHCMDVMTDFLLRFHGHDGRALAIFSFHFHRLPRIRA